MAKRTAIPREMRRQVAKRADYLCEYCLISEEDTFLGCHVDHIISVKHGGSMTFDNLAYACVVCNRQKGSDLGSIDWKTKNLVRFFNPRLDQWSKHFYLQEARLISRTSIGEVTVRNSEKGDGCWYDKRCPSERSYYRNRQMLNEQRRLPYQQRVAGWRALISDAGSGSQAGNLIARPI
ncbi:MAG: HNH endonuclease signature motif containing protein [Cyanobacteria bacterium J06634_6]